MVACTEKFCLKNYLELAPFRSVLNLNSNKNLNFHWAHWVKTCKFQKQHLFSKKSFQKKLGSLRESLDQYKKIKVWTQINDNVHEMSLHDLYSSYIDPRLKQVWFGPKKTNIFISMGPRQGPYMKLSSLKWLNPSILKDFIYEKILDGKSILRDFRLEWNTPISCLIHHHYTIKDIELFTHHITKQGLLLRVKGAANLNRILISNKIEIELDLNPFLRLVRLSMDDFARELGKETFVAGKKNCHHFMVNIGEVLAGYNDLDNYANSLRANFYMFIPYSDFLSPTNSISLGAIMQRFLVMTQELLEDDIS